MLWEKGDDKEIFSTQRIKNPMLPVIGMDEDEVVEHIQATGESVYVAVIEVDRHYGGGEEGGWWFNSENVLEQLRSWGVRTVMHDIILLRDKYSNSGYGVYSAAGNSQMYIRVSKEPSVNLPERRPHYE